MTTVKGDIATMSTAAQRPDLLGDDVPSGAQLLTVAEISTMFRVSKMTIYRMVHAGELAHVRVGRSFRVPADAVQAILVSRGSGQLSA